MAVLVSRERVKLSNKTLEYFFGIYCSCCKYRGRIQLVSGIKKPGKVNKFSQKILSVPWFIKFLHNFLIRANSYQHIEECWRREQTLEANVHKAAIWIISEPFSADFI